MRVVDADNSGTLTLDEAKRVAFEHYGFDEETLAPFFGQADENEDGQLDNVEFAGFRSVIRARSVRDAMEKMKVCLFFRCFWGKFFLFFEENRHKRRWANFHCRSN